MEIPISQPLASFTDHFSNVANKRILFSGKFGCGKTHFLKEFFAVNGDNLNAFWLSPVKYSVGQNEDIFEYIKFDLAIRLLTKSEFVGDVKTTFGEDLYLHQYLSNQPLMAIDTLMLLIESIANTDSLEGKYLTVAKTTKEVANKLTDLFKKYKEFKSKIDDAAKGDSRILEKYLEASVLKRGSIFENDLVTQTIRSALEICKIRSEKENVLVIDDFDRLDPEHVFRILNILSVHNEALDDENKFGFDKVIIVCDYDNIANIYAHKYGDKTSFLGYITKFFSSEVFYFSNNDAIMHFCQNQLGEVIDDVNTVATLGLLLSYFVDVNVLTIRDITKITIPSSFPVITFGPYKIFHNHPQGVPYNLVFMNSIFISSTEIDFFITSDDYPFIKAIRILCLIFGGYPEFKKRLRQIQEGKVKDKNYSKKHLQHIIKSLLILLHHAKMNSMGELGRLCFSYHKDRYEDSLRLIGQPSAQMFGVDLAIPTGWKADNLYKGDVSYYEYVRFHLKRLDFAEENMKFTNFGSFKNLINDIIMIVIFLEDTNSLERMGITRSLD